MAEDEKRKEGSEAEEDAGPDAPALRSPGRRRVDHVRRGTYWALLVGTLLQGGFVLFAWRLVAIGERQLNRERDMLIAQHTELVSRITDGLNAAQTDISNLALQVSGLRSDLSQIQGMAMGHYRCVPCPPPRVCPQPACPAPVIVMPREERPEKVSPPPRDEPRPRQRREP